MSNLKNIDNNVNDNTPILSIGVVARLLDVSVHTIRLYESEGLILPFKKDSKHRLYTQNDVVRLKCIINSIREKKFSINAIKTLYAMIPCWAIKKRSKKEQMNCQSYYGNLMPCWTYKHLDNRCSDLNCSECEVYMNHANCDDIKNSIRKYC